MRRFADEGTSVLMPAWLADLGFAEIQQRIADGSLLSLLDAELTSCGPKGRLQAVRLGYAKHHRDCSAMVLELTFASAAAELAVTRELVVYVPRRPTSPASGRAWWYPADPYLPGVQQLTRGGDFFHPSGWEKPWAGLDPEVAVPVRRLAYYPGRRASFLIGSAGASTRLVVKFVRRAALGECVEAAERLADTPLADQVVVPRFLSYSSRQCALLYEYVPGTGLDHLDRAQRNTPHLRAHAARVLARIHAVAAPGLRQWSAAKELGLTRLLVADVQRRFPSAGAIGPFFDNLVPTLSRSTGPYVQLIHNDFSARNVLRLPRAGEAPVAEDLAVIDWDGAVLGPVERDLASFVSGFTSSRGEARASVDTYQRHTGRAIDLELVNAFVGHQRLLKLCRRALAAGRIDTSDVEGVLRGSMPGV